MPEEGVRVVLCQVYIIFFTLPRPDFRAQRTRDSGGGLSAFSGAFAESQSRQEENKRKENEEYLKRVRELGEFLIIATYFK
jgi:hypothetical protein